jgi:Cap4 SAVED domain
VATLEGTEGISVEEPGLDLLSRLDHLPRDGGRSLDDALITVEQPVVLPSTQATCRCHFIAFDGNGRPMVKEFVSWLVREVVNYCIPRSRVARAKAADERSNGTAETVGLANDARKLFANLKLSGEGGEMLLYLLLEIGLGMPQLLCKMSLKTDEEMHFHGADGAHGKRLEDGRLALYWGESKLYASVNEAIDAALSGLVPYLTDTGGKAAKRDLDLLRDYLDLEDPQLTDLVKGLFDETKLGRRNVEVRGAALVGFSLADYQFPLEDDRATATEAVADLLKRCHERAGLKISENELSEFVLEIFFVPFPDVGAFRTELRGQLGLPPKGADDER